METLYRFENADGRGMFTSMVAYGDIPTIAKRHNRNRKDGSSYWPTFRQDDELKAKLPAYEDIYDYNFAYLNLSQTRRAVKPKEYIALLENDQILYKIEVDDCIKSKHQAIFKPENVVTKTPIELY